MGCPILELTINFLYLFEMVSLYPSKSNNVPFMENAAVKWFHMRCACSMGCPILELTINFLYLLEMVSL